MILKNSIGVETRFGYRTFDLYVGDLFDTGAESDLLVASAYVDSYSPDPGTLFEALKLRLSLDVSLLKRQFDLRSALSIWISEPLPNGPFKRLLCVEMIGSRLTLEEAVANIFVGVAILEAKGLGPHSMTMPMLGSGQQFIDPKRIVQILVPEAQKALRESRTLERICFADRNPKKIDELDGAMNEFLKRVKVVIPKNDLMDQLVNDIGSIIDSSFPYVPLSSQVSFVDLKRLISTGRPKSFEIGVVARRLIEFIVNDLLEEKKPSPDLVQRIDKTSGMGVAPWIRSYMHTLRLFGNESVHEKSSEKRIPPYVAEDDLVICLFCIQRLLGFWLDLRKEKRELL